MQKENQKTSVHAGAAKDLGSILFLKNQKIGQVLENRQNQEDAGAEVGSDLGLLRHNQGITGDPIEKEIEKRCAQRLPENFVSSVLSSIPLQGKEGEDHHTDKERCHQPEELPVHVQRDLLKACNHSGKAAVGFRVRGLRLRCPDPISRGKNHNQEPRDIARSRKGKLCARPVRFPKTLQKIQEHKNDAGTAGIL